DRFDLGRDRTQAVRLALLAKQGERALLGRDEHVARPHLGDRVERDQEVLLVVELLPRERLGLHLIRRDEERLRLDRQSQRLAVGVEHDRHVAARKLATGLGVEVVVDVAREGAGEDDELRVLRQVPELFAQHLELFRPDCWSPLVDLRVRASRRVDDGRRRARLALDAYEVIEDRLRRQLLDDARARRAADEPGRDDGDPEGFQRARDIDALAARERDARARPVTLPALEVRHGERPVDRRVECDGDDHGRKWARWWNVLPAYHPRRQTSVGLLTVRAATRVRDPTTWPPLVITTLPSAVPARTGSATDAGAVTRSVNGRPMRATVSSGFAATR